MQITTKFNVGDQVYYMKDNAVQLGIVSAVFVDITTDVNPEVVTIDSVNVRERYSLYVGNLPSKSSSFPPHCLFASRQNLLDSL